MPHAEPIRIEISQLPGGVDRARCGEYEAITRNGAEMQLARILVAAGFGDCPWQTERDARVRLFGKSLHALARLTLSEGDRQRISFARWVPMVSRPVSKAA